MATNITAIGYIGKDLEVKNRVFYNGLVYTLGRALSYSLLAILFFIGADQFKLSSFFQLHGEKILGPLLIIVGIFMLGIIKINFPGLSFFSTRILCLSSIINYYIPNTNFNIILPMYI